MEEQSITEEVENIIKEVTKKIETPKPQSTKGVELDTTGILFENETGQEYCKKSLNGIDFTIIHEAGDKYGITFMKDGKKYNIKVSGKIFINGAKPMRKHLKNALIEFIKIDEFEANIIVDNLWSEFTGIFGEIIFSTSLSKRIKDAQYFRESESLTLNVDTICDDILGTNHFLTFIDSKETYFYKNGVFVRYGDEEIERIVRNILKNHTTNNKIKEITSNIKSRTLIERSSLNLDFNLINMKNGMFDIKANKLIEHGAQYKSIRQLDIKYNENATCPQIEKFMKSIVKEEEIIPLYEAIGYAMIPKTNIKNSTLMLTGSGDNGKSKFLDMTRAFIGAANTSSVSLHSLENDKFASSDLDGKLLNIFADLSSESLYDNSTFKILTGDDDKMRAEKKYSNAYIFDNTARLMFSANKLPPVPDDDMTAFFNRMMVFTFDNKFTGDKADKNIKEKITNPEELSGLFNIVVKSLRIVLKNDGFTYSKSNEEIETIYRMHSDDIMVFASEKITEDDDGNSIPKSTMYELYKEWCKSEDIVLKSKNQFTRRLTSLGFFIGKKGSRGGQVLSWVNCDFKLKEDKLRIGIPEIKVNQQLIQVPLVPIE